MKNSVLPRVTFDQFESSVSKWAVQAQSESGFRFLLEYNGIAFPILFRLNQDFNDRLLITYNGAVDRSKAPEGIVFQRSTWIPEIEANVLSFADPTLLPFDKLSLGWGQISKDEFAPRLYTEILDSFRTQIGLPQQSKSLHFGSSAGGFQAMATAVYDRGSRALTNNPQFNWFSYDLKGRIDAVRSQVLDDPRGTRTIEREPWRFRIWELFFKEKYFPHVESYINIASHNDYHVQLPALMTGLNSLDFLGTDWRHRIVLYRDPVAQHSPMAKIPALRAINESLSRL